MKNRMIKEIGEFHSLEEVKAFYKSGEVITREEEIRAIKRWEEISYLHRKDKKVVGRDNWVNKGYGDVDCVVVTDGMKERVGEVDEFYNNYNSVRMEESYDIVKFPQRCYSYNRKAQAK